MNVDRGELVGRRLEDVPVVMGGVNDDFHGGSLTQAARLARLENHFGGRGGMVPKKKKPPQRNRRLKRPAIMLVAIFM